jgi:carbonic anhydrase/acetyltransferase-like protein (isoleucine patch superfamily)
VSERPWFVLPKPEPPRGWLVFSDSFLSEQLGGPTFVPIARTGVAVLQVAVMLLANIPVVRWFVEAFAQCFGRNVLGFVMRSSYWRTRLAHLGQDTIIDQGVSIWGADRVRVGAASFIGMDTKLSAGGRAGERGSIEIGDFSYVAPGCLLSGNCRIRLGDFVAISGGVRFYSSTNLPTRPREPGLLVSMAHAAPADRQEVLTGEITIEDYAVIGIGTIVFPDVRLGRGSIVHPYAELRTSFPEFANVSGFGRAKQNGLRQPLRVDARALASPRRDA